MCHVDSKAAWKRRSVGNQRLHPTAESFPEVSAQREVKGSTAPRTDEQKGGSLLTGAMFAAAGHVLCLCVQEPKLLFVSVLKCFA